MSRPAIEIERLAKDYGDGRGIFDLSFSFASGEIFGFLGPNGAGKTTTIRTLLGFLRPTGGTARVLGHDIVEESISIRRRTGYLPSDTNLYPHLTGRAIVALALASRGLRDGRRTGELARRLDIDLSRRVKQCSKGMRQKVALVAAIAPDPDLLILDEPDTGLDPLMQATLGQLIREHASRGKTVFFSSHNLAEVEALCQRVALIRDGRLAAVDEVAALRRRRMKKVVARFAGSPPDLSRLPEVQNLQLDGPKVSLMVMGDVRPLMAALCAASLEDVTISDPSLEDVFMEFYKGTGRST